MYFVYTVKPRNSGRQNSGKPHNSGQILAPKPLFSKNPQNSGIMKKRKPLNSGLTTSNIYIIMWLK